MEFHVLKQEQFRQKELGYLIRFLKKKSQRKTQRRFRVLAKETGYR